MAYNKAREEKKWRLWKEAEEKQLRSLGVSENDMSFSLTPKLRNCFSSASFQSRHFFSSLALLYAILFPPI